MAIRCKSWPAPHRLRHLNVGHVVVGVANFRSSLITDIHYSYGRKVCMLGMGKS